MSGVLEEVGAEVDRVVHPVADLLRRFDVNGPRYTSYPTANLFQPGDWQNEYLNTLHAVGSRPLALYVHVPFCARICYYCACNRIHTGNRTHAETYVDYLCREISLLGAHLPDSGAVQQLHFGGGTPTFLDDSQMQRIFDQLGRSFTLCAAPYRDYSIEVDPRGVSAERISRLAALGFNRLSVGVQDFNPAVQAAINRLQSEEETAEVVAAARAHGMQSVNFDLIYGLPRQTPAGFSKTLDRVTALQPDRLSIYSYAHLPQRFKAQRQIAADELPDAAGKLELLSLAVEKLEDQGYVYVGMDHFARPGDSLVKAMRSGTLHRSFMGYTSHADCQLLGLGVSAIGQTGRLYVQNHKDLPSYYASLDTHNFPLERGCRLNGDDQLRRYVIQSLMCKFKLNFAEFSRLSGQAFAEYFRLELPRIQQLADAGLLSLNSAGMRVTEQGRYLIRNVCMVFDGYLTQQAQTDNFSRAI